MKNKITFVPFTKSDYDCFAGAGDTARSWGYQDAFLILEENRVEVIGFESRR